jgi:hypothetical protein
VRARVEDRAGDYCQDQHAKCDYQREHRLLLSAANGRVEQMAKWRAERAEALQSTCCPHSCPCITPMARRLPGWQHRWRTSQRDQWMSIFCLH